MDTIKQLRVLIADDEALVSDVVQYLLEQIGHKVVGRATDGRQVVDLVRDIQPDIVLMDIRMPEIDGLEATRQIQAACPTPVVLLTAHDDPELVSRASEAGAGAYLVKPPNARDMQRTMVIAMARFADLMELRRLNAELEKALANVKLLSGLLPICASCKKIRDDQGYWTQIEQYIQDHSQAEFSHSICPECAMKLYPEFYKPKTR
ncbi:MAG: response regulator [Deltaproteobacteria bacterium]|nr:response regulator [Deltaproteobacteria bacterium]